MTLRHIFCCGLTAMFAAMTLPSLATPTIVDVAAKQRYPWNGLVDVTVTIQGTSNSVDSAECLFAATNSLTKMAISVTHITRNGADFGSEDTWKRQFVWDAKTDVGAIKISDVELTVNVLGGVQLWEDGPCWAECNVGASKPEDYGYYFWWGDTVGYKRVGESWNAADGSQDGFSFWSGNCPLYGAGNSFKIKSYVDSMGNLLAERDAATVHLGTPWRIPTDAEWRALIDNCSIARTTHNGVGGWLVTGKGAYSSNSIFIPAAGKGSGVDLLFSDAQKYRSSTRMSNSSQYAECMLFSSSFSINNDYLYYGLPIRPLRKFTK